MKSILSSNWLRCSGTFFAGAALSLTAWSAWGLPALSTPLPEKVATRMTELKTSEERWIQIDLTKQRLIAWEGKKPVHAVIISTGKDSTPTLPGVFKIQSMRRTDRMRGPGYDIPNVPYAMYYDRGYAIHGTTWHRKFGTPVSHGCTNVAVDHARWLYNWASVGTAVVIHK